MHAEAETVWQRLEQGEQQAGEWLRRQEYTDLAKQAAAARLRDVAAKDAIAAAKAALTERRKDVDRKRRRFTAAQRAAAAGQDTARQMLVAEKSKAAGADVGRLLALVREAIDLGEYDRLQAVYDFTLPALRAAIGQPMSTAWAAPKLTGGDVARLENDLVTAIGDVEPLELREARRELADAETDLLDLQTDLRRVNERTQAGGGPGLLAPLTYGEVGITAGSIESGRVVYGRGEGLL